MRPRLRFLVVVGGLGLAVGLLTVALSGAVDGATALFAAHPALGWLMPVAGMASFGLYRVLQVDFAWSTASVMEAVEEGRPVPPLLLPAIMGGTALTVLGGGSVGKEAAALQMGAAASSLFERWVGAGHRPLLAPAAMGAALGAMLSTPLAGAMFSFEALRRLPRSGAALAGPLVCSLVAWAVTEGAGVRFLSVAPPFPLPSMKPELVEIAAGAALALPVGLAAGGCALVFCRALEGLRRALARLGAPVFALAVGGVVTSLLLGYADLFGYEGLRALCGTGAVQVEETLTGTPVLPIAFLLKAALTLLTLAGGYKGGEIMPVLAVGACLGSTLAQGATLALGSMVAPFAPMFAAAGSLALFAACTNCPLTAVMLGMQLCGLSGLLLAPAIAVASAMGRSVSLYPTALPSA